MTSLISSTAASSPSTPTTNGPVLSANACAGHSM